MGYSTQFTGTLTITPPLNPHEIDYLDRFSDVRHMNRTNGPYYIGRDEADVLNGNQPPAGQPGLWCDWSATPDGTGLHWTGAEKTYNTVEWVQYLIDHFLKAGAAAAGQVGFGPFTFDHVVSGEVHAQGDTADDAWTLVVADNVVSKREPGAAEDPDSAAVAALTAAGCETWLLTPQTINAVDDTVDSYGIYAKGYWEEVDGRLTVTGLRVGSGPDRVVVRFGDWLVRHRNGDWGVLHAAQTPAP